MPLRAREADLWSVLACDPEHGSSKGLLLTRASGKRCSSREFEQLEPYPNCLGWDGGIVNLGCKVKRRVMTCMAMCVDGLADRGVKTNGDRQRDKWESLGRDRRELPPTPTLLSGVYDINVRW